MSVFHQWLLADPANQSSACAIILHGDPSLIDGHLVKEIADYLNEYDDDGDGRWLPATEELVDKISRDANHLRVLGLEENNLSSADELRAELPKILAALSQRGHVVFCSSGISDQEPALANTFHAGVGSVQNIKEKCHLILDPDLMNLKCIAHVIGDVFLEWCHCEMLHNAPICDIR